MGISMKTILSKKDSGMLDQVLPLIVGVFALTFVIMLMLGAMESIQIKNNVDLVARRAILQVETYGYIEESLKSEMLEQLADAKVDNASIETRGFSQTSQTWGSVNASSPAAYGQKVEVEITGETTLAFGNMGGTGVFSSSMIQREIPIKVVRISTSKN